MRAVLVALCLMLPLCPLVLQAQVLPDAPSAVVNNTRTEMISALQPVQPRVNTPTVSRAADRKVIDRKFALLGGLVLATTTADMELTQRCQDAGTCVEMNPTIPRARWAKHAVNVPTNTAVMYWAYRWKKAGKRLWWVPPVADIAVHAVGLGSNIRFAF